MWQKFADLTAEQFAEFEEKVARSLDVDLSVLKLPRGGLSTHGEFITQQKWEAALRRHIERHREEGS